MTVSRRWTLVGGAAGLVLGVVYTLAPLMVWALAAAAVLLRYAGRGLPASERRLLTATLAIAFAVRLLAIGALAVAGAVGHADPSLGAILTGDEAYVLSRALRTRDILLGVAVTKYDYVVAFDDYGRNSYLGVLTWLQVLFGPTPYGMRMLNAAIFTAGTVLLFREARRAFGWQPAFVALLVMLFYPTLFVWSISLLKEPLYLFGTSLVLVSAIHLVRRRAWMARAWPALGVAAGLAIIGDLRPGAIIVTTSGIGVGIVLREVTRTAARFAAAATLAIVAAGAVVAVPSLQRRLMAALEGTAKQHTGHVFTVGHAYKTLDEGFYMTPQPPGISNMTLTADEAARYVVRSAVSFVLVPVPWQIESTRELAYLPEQLLWYGIVLLAPFGVVAGWRRDPLVTSLLVGYILPTAAALALTNGNVGTMLRLRGVVIPYLAVLAGLGACHVLETLASRRHALDLGSRPTGFAGITL
jgi:hypothetical protein